MLTIVALLIGDIVLTLLAIIALIYAVSGLSNWLTKHHNTKIRRLLRTLHPDTTDKASQSREEAKERIYPTYPIQSIYECPEAREQVNGTGINPVYSTGEKQKEKGNAKHHNTSKKCVPHLHSLILNIFRRKVNQSGKEPLEPCT